MIASRAIEYMEAELAGPLASEFSGFDLVNGAARLMESMFEWRYLTKTGRTISLRATVSGSTATYTAATSTLAKTGAFASYALVPGDYVQILDGSTVVGRFNVLTRVGDDSITIDAPSITADIAGTVTFELDTARIALSSDIERITRVYRGRPNSGGTFLSSSTELQLLDESYIAGSSYVTGYTLEWGTTTAKSLPVPVLRVWPPTSTGDVDALSCVYLRAWPTIDNEDDILPFPSYMETLFLEICRAYAVGYEDQVRLDIAVQGIKEGEIFKAAAKYDSGGLRPLGTPSRGAVRRRRLPFDQTSANFVHRHLDQ